MLFRRLWRDTRTYCHGLVQGASQGWNQFFFKPADPTSLGLLRIAVGLLSLWSLAIYGSDLISFLGDEGWIDRQSLIASRPPDGGWLWSFWLFLPDAWLRPAWVVSVMILISFTLGFWSRTTAWLAWVIMVSTVRRAAPFQFGFDQVLTTALFYLAITGASGQAVSLDRFWSRLKQHLKTLKPPRTEPIREWILPTGCPEPTISANLAIRLIQIHLTLIYAMAGLAKLQGAGWWAGAAIWPTWYDQEFAVWDLSRLAAYPLLINFATHATIATEIGYPFLIWNRWTRPLFLFALTIMHIGIGLTLGLMEFGLTMLALNLAFVPGVWARGLVSEPGRVKILYDGFCPYCRKSMAWIKSLDPDHVIEPIDLNSVEVSKVDPRLNKADCLKAMHVIRSDGKLDKGYQAVAQIALALPTTWIFGLMALTPGLSRIGDRVYQRIADRRPRETCTDDVCSIPQKARNPKR